MKTWVKLYTEINRDPKIGSLTWAQRGIWSAILALAGEIDKRDKDDAEIGALGQSQEIAWHLRCNEDELSDALLAFEERGMVHHNDDTWYVTNYSDRQRRAPSQKRKAVARRVKAHREMKRECNEGVTSLEQGVTPADKTREDKIREEEKRQDKTRKEKKRQEEQSLLSEFYQTSIKQYESNIGVIAPAQYNDIHDMLAELEEKGLETWWADAVGVAVDQNKRSWAYVRAVLNNCIKDGKPPDRRDKRRKQTKKKAKTIDPFTGELTEVEVLA